ncbi:uncharacterized protein LOC110452232 [Mizuhopecten yessoensis]|uniref:uncharacterized protein LOC110452232 n=1 Tax=Mizuhopecten yessoensis TaxID=6573 RepID=UPI000B457ECC|nr:uncharacterized protein LOC110452232 [Mizuhopecten yessoensis]
MGSSASRMCGTGAMGVVKLHRQQVSDPAPTPDTDSTAGELTDDDALCRTEAPRQRNQVVEIAATGGTEVTWSDFVCREKGIVVEQIIPPINTAYVGLYSSKKQNPKIIQRFDSINDDSTVSESITNFDDIDDDTDDVTSGESSGNVTPRACDSFGKEIAASLINELLGNLVMESTEINTSGTADVNNTDPCEIDKNTTKTLEDFVDNYEFDMAGDYLTAIEKASHTLNEIFNQFPTPKVLRAAQEAWEENRVIPPRDDSGRPLPHPYIAQETVVECGIEAVVSSLKAKTLKENVGLKDVLAQIQTSCADKEAVIRCVFSLVQFARRAELEDLIGQLMNGWVEEDILRVHVFNHICRSMDIPTATISGYHKLDVSDGTEDKPKLSLWSAVLLNDIWKYIDTTRRIAFRDEKHLWKAYRPSFCTSWLVSPLCFIQTHLPKKRYWQQLSRPVSRSEWDSMVLLTPHFFYYNLQLHSHDRYEIPCDSESVTILLRYPERNQLLFEAKLLFQGNPVLITLPQNTSSTFVETRISDNSELVIRVVPPHTGEFTLAIYGLDILENPYKCMHLCSYKIQCNRVSGDVSFFPSVSQGRYQWGPGADTIKAGLSPANCFDSSIVCDASSLHLKFRMTSGCESEDIVVTMAGGDLFDEVLNRYVFFWTSDGLAHFLVHSPGPGQYVLNICQRMSCSTVAVCSYLVDFTSKTSDVSLPPGFTDSFNKLGTTKAGLTAGFNQNEWLTAFSTAPVTGEVVLQPVFDHEHIASSSIQLRMLGRDCMDMTVYTKCNLEDKLLSCTVLLPRIGTYLLSLYVETPDGSTACWHNAIILAEVPCANWAPFPSRTREVPLNFCLHSPLSGQIPAKSEVMFSLQLNEAHDVAVVTSGGWFHLEKSDSNSSLWTGKVNTGARGTDMRLCARFESGSGTFTPLCIYKVISGEEYESRSLQQSTLRENLLRRAEPNIS